MKINYPLVLPPVIFVIVCAVAIMLSQILSDKPLSAEDLHQKSSELASYSRESTTLLKEYEKEHLTSTYLTEQLQQIQKQVTSISDDLSTAQLTTKDEGSVSQLLDITEQYSKEIRSVTRSPENKTLLSTVRSDLEKQTSHIDTITKHYE